MSFLAPSTPGAFRLAPYTRPYNAQFRSVAAEEACTTTEGPLWQVHRELPPHTVTYLSAAQCLSPVQRQRPQVSKAMCLRKGTRPCFLWGCHK
jgi:hypothetical protein